MLKYVAIALIAFSAVGCATTPQEQQDNASKADQLFGKVKVAYVIATVGVAGYNVVCKTTLVSSPICAKNIADIINTSMRAASDAIAGAERVFAAANSTVDQKMRIVNIVIALVTELTNAVAKYVPAGVAAPSASFAGS